MSDVHSRYNEIEKLIDEEKFEEAISGLTGIVGQEDGFVLAHLALARVYTKTGQHDLAIEHAEKACQLGTAGLVQLHRVERDVSTRLGGDAGPAVHHQSRRSDGPGSRSDRSVVRALMSP